MGAVIDRAGYRQLPIGSEDFEEVVSERVYVDKTALLCDLIDSAYKVTLFCRPRRFGKSLAMRMLQCFFEAPVENGMRSIPRRSGLFEGLDVSRAGGRYLREMGAHPVIFLSLGSVGGSSWEETRGQLARAMADEFNRHGYVREPDALAPAEMERFDRIASGRCDDADLSSSLAFLSDLLCRHHGSGTVILIDEYDHPVTAGHLRGYRDEAVSFMRNWLTGALKATTSLRLACLTGVQRVSRESIFSGLNNLVVSTAMDDEFTEGFGFTRTEAEALAVYCGLPAAKLPEMRDWYDGYCFGGVDVYNPWSVLNYLKRRGAAQPYWGNTSDNAIVHQLFVRADAVTADDLGALAAGGSVSRPLNLATVFSELDDAGMPASAGALWGQLYLAGYVTTDDVALPNDTRAPRRLRVPNREVEQLYRDEFVERVVPIVGTTDRLVALHAALVSGDPDALVRELDRSLSRAPSYLDLTSENSYHMFVLGLLYDVRGYRFPRSNRESGAGRPDIWLEPELENQAIMPAIVVELKRADSPEALGDAVEAALAQARDRRYGEGLAGRGVVRWGVAFCGKRAQAACTAE